MSSQSSSASGGVSGLTLLGVLFVGLKLTGYIDWSWWYVTMPFWLPISLIVSFLILIGVINVLK